MPKFSLPIRVLSLSVLVGASFMPAAAASPPAQATLTADCGATQLSYNLLNQGLDELFDNGEGHPGPRRLVVDQTSTMPSLGSRSFVQATPLDIDQMELQIEKLSGSERGGQTRFVVCKTDQAGQTQWVDEFSISGGTETVGQRLQRTYAGLKDQRLSLRVQGGSLLGQARFRIHLQRPGAAGQTWGQPWVPERQAPAGPVPGFADLHNHEAADLAYAGGWVWGSHREGPLSERLPQCTGDDHATIEIPGLNLKDSLVAPHRNATHGFPDFSDWPSWHDIKHQQVSATWLKQAHEKGLNLVVASLVNNQWLSAAMVVSGHANPAFSPEDMEAVKRELRSLQALDAASDWYTIVHDPWEARRAIAKGQLAVVLAVEVSNLMPEGDGPWREQLYDLYDMGVRSIQLAHETNSRFSGAAYHRDIFKPLSQIKAWFNPDIAYASTGDGVHNPLGLTSDGHALLDEMVRLNMLVDLAHLPLKSQRQIYQQMAEQHRYYPIFISHTRMDPLLTPADKAVLKEFVTTPETLQYVRQTGGMLGLRTGEDPMLDYGSPKEGSPEVEIPHKGRYVANNCDGSTRSFTQFYQYADDRNVAVGFASDFNGFITQIVPRFGPEACANAPDASTRAAQIAAQGPIPTGVSPELAEYQVKGLAHVGLLPAVLEDMQRLGADTTALSHSAEAFLKMWERTYDPQRQRLP